MTPLLRHGLFVVALTVCLFAPVAFADTPRLSAAYPDLATGILSEAHIADLPEGELIRSGELVVTAEMLDEKVAALPPRTRGQAANFAYYVADSLAAENILLRAAAGDDALPEDPQARQQLFQRYMRETVGDIEVSEDEVKAFFEENSAMLPNVAFEQVRPGIEGHLMRQKQEAAWDAYVRDTGTRTDIRVNREWIDEQAERVKENPVDQARAAEKPLLVVFSADGCASCGTHNPALAAVREKYAAQASVMEVNLNQHVFLAGRYRVADIPLLVFFDKEGNETFRQTGVMSEAEIMTQLKRLGVG